mgnify:CR=1 FL=1
MAQGFLSMVDSVLEEVAATDAVDKALVEVIPSDIEDGSAYGVMEAAQEREAIQAESVMEEVQAEPVVFDMPPTSYFRKGQRFQLVFQGVCSSCAHCAMKLTDAISIQRGLGPICSKKGYLEDPTNPDEMQAMIDLAEYPDLVDFLTKTYKPQGVRGLMNGLVKICSLNRRSPVHQACCDAIESLGFRSLASLLRESIAIIEIKSPKFSNLNTHVKVWVKKSEWNWTWSRDLKTIPNLYFSKQEKGWMVPISAKRPLWELVKKHFGGFCCKTEKGTVKVPAV